MTHPGSSRQSLLPSASIQYGLLGLSAEEGGPQDTVRSHLWTRILFGYQIFSSVFCKCRCRLTGWCSQQFPGGPIAPNGNIKLPSKRMVGQRGGKCLLFLMRKGEANEWKRQLLILKVQRSSGASCGSVWPRPAAAEPPSDLFICLLACDFLHSAFQYPSLKSLLLYGSSPWWLAWNTF